ncbi:hypothetical protein [Mycolicibacterium phlei]|jgi:hypothetical protein
MTKIIRRGLVAAAASAPLALTLLMAPPAAAQPLNCPGGWWDPVENVCRGPVATVPLNCPPGEYWHPIKNVCRPLGQY